MVTQQRAERQHRFSTNPHSRKIQGMADTYIIGIDIERLRANLSAAENRQMTRDEVITFLEESGITRTDEGWLAEEISLSVLGANEYQIVRRG